jgi:C-terminal processing protease CtpA/Prc
MRTTTPRILVLVVGALALLSCSEPNTPQSCFDVLWRDFDAHYGQFEVKNIDWDEIRARYRPLLNNNSTDDELFAVLQGVLAELNDSHIILRGGGKRFQSGIVGQLGKMTDFSVDLVKRRYLADANTAANGSITYGHVSDKTGYIHMATMELPDGNSAELVSAFDDAFAPLVDCAGLIIDIRGNGGGQFQVAEAIANRFADTQRLAEKIRYRHGPRHSDFADPILYYAEPAGRRQFTEPVILLTNRYSVSAAEIFTITMRVFPNVTHMGDTTAGALDGPIDRELPNGWLYKLPLGLTTDHNDICYEGQGITPEIQITNSAGTIESGTDQVLEAAIGRFSI